MVCSSVLTSRFFFSLSRRVAAGLVRIMEPAFQTTRRRAMCVTVQRDSLENIAKQVIKFSVTF